MAVSGDAIFYPAVLFLILVPLVISECVSFYQEPVVVKSRLGSLRGHKQYLDDNAHYYAFQGIKYAQAPIGRRRFQAINFSIVFSQHPRLDQY